MASIDSHHGLNVSSVVIINSISVAVIKFCGHKVSSGEILIATGCRPLVVMACHPIIVEFFPIARLPSGGEPLTAAASTPLKRSLLNVVDERSVIRKDFLADLTYCVRSEI